MSLLSEKIVAEGFTFDDLLLLPAYSEVLPRQVSIASNLTQSVRLELPILSAAMDTVTESAMAIALAREGAVRRWYGGVWTSLSHSSP